MAQERDQPTIGTWIILPMIALVPYVLSIGPAAWCHIQLGKPEWFSYCFQALYLPLIILVVCGPEQLGQALGWYVALFGIADWHTIGL